MTTPNPPADEAAEIRREAERLLVQPPAGGLTATEAIDQLVAGQHGTAASDLVAFLRARLDEDEQAAAAATNSTWETSRGESREDYEFWRVHSAPSGDLNVTEVAGAGFDGTGGVHSEADARHIVRHDPARVLAEVDAKWRIVDAYEASAERLAEDEHDDVQWADMLALKYTAQLLALPYADHPDYRAEWAATDD